jgi:anti-anti-sigma factor
MGTERLVVELERAPDGAVILHLAGKLEHGTAALLDGVLHALSTEPNPVVLDLSGIEHIDARGLELLLEAEGRALEDGSRIEVTGVRESLRERRPPFPS